MIHGSAAQFASANMQVPTPSGDIAMELDDLNARLQGLQDLAINLASRLGPVLQPELPANASASKLEAVAQSPLGDRLHGYNTMAGNVASALSSILSRIQL